jgi:hypothetical protein
MGGNVWGYDGDAAEDMSLLGCYAVFVRLRVSDFSKDDNVIIIMIRVSLCGLLDPEEKAL